MLSATMNAAKSAQICPKVPKSAEICPKTISLKNFEIPPKYEIFLFFLFFILFVEEALSYMLTVWIFNTSIFHMPVLLSKNCICV
jgi:hypothetical protein